MNNFDEKEFMAKRQDYAFKIFLSGITENPSVIINSAIKFSYEVADKFLSAGREDFKELTEQEKIWIKKYKETYGTNKNQ